jgi:hypothetical protein
MKRSIFIIATALLISTGITAQNVDNTQIRNRTQVKTQDQTQTQVQTQTQNMDQVQQKQMLQKRDQTGDMDQTRTRNKISAQDRRQARIKARDASTHGQNVSGVARSTQSGVGKGNTVSTHARSKGQIQQSQMRQRTISGNQSGNSYRGARNNSMNGSSFRVSGGAGMRRK